jgi:hypothetical protein
MPKINNEINVTNSQSKTNYGQDFKDQIIGVYKSRGYETIKDCAAALEFCRRFL